MPTDIYQDIRVNGETVYHGRRECETRWRVLKPFMERFQHHDTFKVLDFGANYGYFSWRIHEDYPQAHITTIDSRPLLKVLYKINKPVNMLQLDNMDTDMLREHAEDNRYDVILLMSILHHFDNYEEILEIFQSMSNHLIIEADYPNKPNFKDNQKEIHHHLMKYNPCQLNTWIGHDRPIYHLNQYETPIMGVVAAGQGKAQKSLKDLQHIFDWIDLQVYPGTLNLGLYYPLHINWTIKFDNYETYPLTLNGLPVLAIQDPRLPNPYRLEIISRYKLRELFGLADNQTVIVGLDNRDVWEDKSKSYNYELDMYMKLLRSEGKI